ncbi:MAG: hypothetical protein ISR45_10200 [Rhodospirillales bacterium]|nr:hypothetical protein [Rhodospirillales bacterium]
MSPFAKTILVLALFVTSPVVAQGAGRIVELGLTPSPVFGLWTNINMAVLAYSKSHSSDEDWLRKLENMRPNIFSGKEPANVLERVKLFRNRLDELSGGRMGNAADTLLEGNLPFLLTSEDDRVTPSLVYLHSGQVLVNIAEEILHSSATAIEISPFFKDQIFTGKTPSDVFGLVDLGLRRLDEILNRKKAGKLSVREGAR